MSQLIIKGPLFTITVTTRVDSIQSIDLSDTITNISSKPTGDLQHSIVSQFEKYLSGIPVVFDIPLQLDNLTPFQRLVFKRLADVTYGNTISYEALATDVKTASHRRAVAMALSANPFPIVIPCHRVVPKHFTPNNIGGFSCGTSIKRALLGLEGVLRK